MLSNSRSNLTPIYPHVSQIDQMDIVLSEFLGEILITHRYFTMNQVQEG